MSRRKWSKATIEGEFDEYIFEDGSILWITSGKIPYIPKWVSFNKDKKISFRFNWFLRLTYVGASIIDPVFIRYLALSLSNFERKRKFYMPSPLPLHIALATCNGARMYEVRDLDGKPVDRFVILCRNKTLFIITADEIEFHDLKIIGNYQQQYNIYYKKFTNVEFPEYWNL